MQTTYLPRELEEKILLPFSQIKSIARFRLVCKGWNTLLSDRSFTKRHLARARCPQFILASQSKIYSVEVNLDDDDPSIKVQNLPFDIPCHEFSWPKQIQYCDGLLMFVTCNGIGICNPWLRQIKWTKSTVKDHYFNGMGYDNTKSDHDYKIIEIFNEKSNLKPRINDFGSDAWEPFELELNDPFLLRRCRGVSLNGTLYWVAFKGHYFIQSFDFSMQKSKPYCSLPPSQNGYVRVARSLEVFRGDRFSYLEQNSHTRGIKIWVTKEKIKDGDGGDVEWMNFMNVSVPKWSKLQVSSYSPSYFINEDDEDLSTLVLCCLNKERKPHIYISKGTKFYEIKVNDFIFPLSTSTCTYFPSLVQVPTFKMTDRGKTNPIDEYSFAHPRGVEAINGNGENMWNDGFFDNIKKIKIGWCKDGLVFLKFDYCSGDAVVVGDAHGNLTPQTYYQNIIINDDDYIEVIHGAYSETHITFIEFKLHKRNDTLQYGRFDRNNNSLFDLGGEGLKIIGFYGRNSDAYITALGVHLSPSH